MNFSTFIRLAHCESGIPSSKRLWGAVMIATSQLCIIIASILSFVKGTGITEVLKNLIEIDIITGAALLGLQTITNVVSSRTNDKTVSVEE